MSQLAFVKCDGCHVLLTPDAARLTRMARIGLGAESADVCSVECAQSWIAAQFEHNIIWSRELPLTSMIDPDGQALILPCLQ